MNEYIYGVTDLVTGDVSAFVRFNSDDEVCAFAHAVCRSLCFEPDRVHLRPFHEVLSFCRDAAFMRYGEFGRVDSSSYPVIVPCTPVLVINLSPVISSEWEAVRKVGYSVNVSGDTMEGDDSLEES